MTLTKRLEPIFDYFGAHSIPERDAHEAQRAVQRIVIACVTPLIVVLAPWFGVQPRSPVTDIAVTAYVGTTAILSLLYFFYLRHHPGKGVLAQYAFLLSDPIPAALFFFAEPEIFKWLAFLNAVIAARCGWRFGVRTFLLEWGLCFVVGLIVWFTAGLSQLLFPALQYFATLFIGLYLFFPVVRIQADAQALIVAQARMASAEDALRAKSEFLSKVGHELRTPLQSILYALESFELRHKGAEEATLVARVRRAAQSLSTHLFDLLTLARSEAGHLKLQARRCDVRAILGAVVDDAREVAEIRGLTLRFEAPEPVDVCVDSVRLSQVFENLLSNALKYTDAGHVIVTLAPYDRDGERVRFQVSDTGRGIAPGDVAIVFAPYERGRAAPASAESSGIGLAVVKTLVDMMGGTIAVESEVGVGSTFIVEIPAVPAGTTLANGARKVLLIDDLEEALSDLGALARHLGVEVLTASTASAATRLLETVRFDAVFFDLQMPTKTGVELAREARAGIGPNKGSRFIAMTAGEDTEAGQGEPFDDFARKPISSRALMRLLGLQAGADTPSRATERSERTLEARAGLSTIKSL